MRKYKRALLRAQAKRYHGNTSYILHKLWDEFQVKKYGSSIRARNWARGTRLKKDWSHYVAN